MASHVPRNLFDIKMPARATWASDYKTRRIVDMNTTEKRGSKIAGSPDFHVKKTQGMQKSCLTCQQI